MNKEHPLFEQSLEYLRNGGDMPAPKNVNERFETTAVLLKEVFVEVCEAKEGSDIAKQNRLWLKIITSGSGGLGIVLLMLKVLGLL